MSKPLASTRASLGRPITAVDSPPMATNRTGTRTAGDKRRPQILRKAAQLFAKQGYHATSMDEVADAMRLNKATIYHHFPGGKSDLLYGINITALDDLLSRVNAREEIADPTERLEAAIDDMVAVGAESPDRLVVYYQEARWLKRVLPPAQHREIRAAEAEFRAHVAGIVKAGTAAGAFADWDPEMAATSVVTLVGASFLQLKSRKRTTADIATFYRELWLHGLLVR